MSNMSYCRFNNTLNDLQECETALDEFMNGENSIESDSEREKAKELVELCSYIAGHYTTADIDAKAEEYGSEEDE